MGCSKSKPKITSRYFYLEYEEDNEIKQDKWEINTKGKLGSKTGDLFHAKLGGLTATAVMLSYLGTRREVCRMLQKLSHSSRFYIVE